jgi:ribosomal protein L28
MGKTCDLCGRGATKGATRSHSKIKTLKRQGVNLQTKNIDGVKVKVCTSCLRTVAKDVKVKTAK